MSDAGSTHHGGPDTAFRSLETDRLRLRRFRSDDAAAFAAYRSDPDVARYQGWDTPFTLGQAQRFIAGLAGEHPDTPGAWFQFAVGEAATGQLLGDVAAFVDGDDPTLARVGVTIAPEHQGRGFATEALSRLLDYLFLERGKRRVLADCDTRNVASMAVLERLGMRREAHHRQSAWWKGELTDEYVYALLASEWPAPTPRRTSSRGKHAGATPLEAAVDDLAEETRFSGVVRVDRAGGTILARAYGLASRAHGTANTVDTRFAIASATKGLTALTVVRLIEQGALTLDTTARSVLGGDLPLISEEVTVQHLLSHRSGIGDYLDEDGGWEVTDHVLPIPVHEVATTEQYLRVLDGHPPKSPPGERFSYCNSGYVVLALIAERLARTPFHELVQQQVCAPADLRDTAFLRSDELPGGVATGYLAAEGLRTNVFHLPVRGSGDGGLYSTVADIHSLWTSLFAGRIVGLDWVTEMVRPHHDPPAGELGYGLGFWLDRAGAAVILEGYDAGVSFRSTHERATGTTHTVIANTSEGAWPLARRLAQELGSDH